ncbi:MAG: cytochrome c [Cyclobacteriaceae bacterium]
MIQIIRIAVNLMILSSTLTGLLILVSLNTPIADEKINEKPNWFCGTVSPKAYNPVYDSIHLAGFRLWKANCTSCHSMHKKIIGPALAGVFERRDSLWIIRSFKNYDKLLAEGDTTAIALYEEYNRTQHTRFENFTDKETKHLMSYLKASGNPFSTRSENVRFSDEPQVISCY